MDPVSPPPSPEPPPPERPSSGPAAAAASQSAAPGWYPVDAFNQRYWDGHEWTNHMAPLAPAPGLPGGLSMPDERTYCLIMHLSVFIVGFLGPLIMWVIKKDESRLIDHHGKQSMNFHLTMLIASIVSAVLILVIIGIFMLIALGIAYIVINILAAIAANRGEYYVFPMTIQFIK